MSWHGYEEMARQEAKLQHKCVKDIYFYMENENPYCDDPTIGIELIKTPKGKKYFGVCINNEGEGDFAYIYLSPEEARKMAENILETFKDGETV